MTSEVETLKTSLITPNAITIYSPHKQLAQSNYMKQYPIQFSHRTPSIIGVITMAFFLFCAIAAWLSGQGAVSPFFLLFVAMGFITWFNSGETTIDHIRIRHIAKTSASSIYWNEVTEIRVDYQQQAMIFRGQNKQVATYGVAYWPQRMREEALLFLQEQIEQHNIPVIQDAWAPYKFSKNARE